MTTTIEQRDGYTIETNPFPSGLGTTYTMQRGGTANFPIKVTGHWESNPTIAYISVNDGAALMTKEMIEDLIVILATVLENSKCDNHG